MLAYDIAVEIQQRTAPTQDARWMHGLGKMITGRTKAGGAYLDAPRPALVTFTFYEWLPGAGYHNWFRFYDPASGLTYPNSPWLISVELPKVPTEDDGTRLWPWCRFFLSTTPEEFDWLAEREGGVMAEIVATLRELSSDEKVRLRAEARDKWLWDQTAREQASKAEGKVEGKAEGKVEVARQLLRMKMPLIDIVIATGLSEAEIKRLAAEENR